MDGGTEALILACTHYPLAMDQIMEVLNEPLKVVDGPAIVADAVERRWLTAAWSRRKSRPWAAAGLR